MTESRDVIERGTDADIEFALNQMLRGLERQGTVLSELRERASMVLSATGIIASLLGAAALDGAYSHVLAVLAMTSTALGILCCIPVLWRVRDRGRLPEPRADGSLGREGRQWQTTISGRQLQKVARGDVDPVELIDRLALARRVNWRTLRQRTRWFAAACFLLLVQLALWAAVFFERTW
jgi:hypothetical protein